MTNKPGGTATIPFARSGSGQTALVFIHGFLDSGRVWDRVIEGLGPQETQKITFDLPGMGALSGESGPFSLRGYAEQVIALLDTVAVPVVLIAQSMGAQIAELVAVARPKQVSGLVLVTPVPLPGVHAPDEAVAPFKALGDNLDAQRQARLMLSPNLTVADADILTELGRGVTASTVVQLVDAWNGGVSDAGAESHYQGPVLIVRGEADPFVTAEITGAIAQRFKNSVVETLNSAGHWAHFEAADELAALINDFAAQKAWSSTAADWKNAFAEKSASAFEEAFAEDVVLEAATLLKPVVGRENVKHVMEAASKIYERLEFTHSAKEGSRQYVEWEAGAFGGVAFKGVTVISRNEAGQIANVAIHHRPLGGSLIFSYNLGQRLKGLVDSAHFATAENLPEELRK
jgi:pimeloyl-ACP methyl ester carboxylesterase